MIFDHILKVNKLNKGLGKHPDFEQLPVNGKRIPHGREVKFLTESGSGI